MAKDPHIDALIALGMTPTETHTYVWLLQNPGTTGYRISRAIGKPTANTYKALSSLEHHGAVTVAGDDKRLYSAVSPEEFLNSLDKRFRQHRGEAARGLAGLEAPSRAGGIQHLCNRDQVVTRLRAMLGRCRSAALLDLAPAVLGTLVDDLAAADLGAEIVVKVYRPTEIEAVVRVLSSDRHGDALPVNAVVDGREMLLASLGARAGETRVGRAVWSVQPDVVTAAHRALVAELLFADVEGGLDRGMSIDELEDTFAVYKRLRALPGGEADAG